MRGGEERGFALPVTLLGVVVLTALATAAFFGSLVELRIAEAHGRGLRASLAARAGLEHAVGTAPESLGDTLRLALSAEDSATVDALPLLDLADGAVLYLLRSEGFAAAAPRGPARRSLRAVVLAGAPPDPEGAGPEPVLREVPGSRYELLPP